MTTIYKTSIDDERRSAPLKPTRQLFLRAASRKGAAWLWGISDHLGRGVTVLAILGLPTGVGVFSDLGALGVLIGITTLALVIFFQGAYLTWRKDYEELVARQGYESTTEEFRTACDKWVADVLRHLDARAAMRPPAPAFAPFESEEFLAADAHDGETLAIFIEKYRDIGTKLFDTLVDLGHLRGSNRSVICNPRNVEQVRDAAVTVEFGASRIGSEGF